MTEQLYREITARLEQLELELQRLRLWSEERPAREALASQQPFCVDTLTFPQWLQHVFLPRLRGSIEQGAPLPEKCEIAPLAEIYFLQLRAQQGIDAGILLEVLGGIDVALSSPRQAR